MLGQFSKSKSLFLEKGSFGFPEKPLTHTATHRLPGHLLPRLGGHVTPDPPNHHGDLQPHQRALHLGLRLHVRCHMTISGNGK